MKTKVKPSFAIKKTDLEKIIAELNKHSNKLELLEKSSPCIRGLISGAWFDEVSAVLVFHETQNSGTLIADIYQHEDAPDIYVLTIGEEADKTTIYESLIKALSEESLLTEQGGYTNN